MDKKIKKAKWRDLFTIEKNLLSFLSEQAILAGCEKDGLKFIPLNDGSKLERPPKFIHCIISLEGDATKIERVKREIDALKNGYRDIEPSKLFPPRYPVLLNQPLQINYSNHSAYRSNAIDEESKCMVFIKRYSEEDSPEDDIEKLKDIGIRSEVVEKGFGRALHISSSDLLAYASAKKITVREKSGQQYTVNVRYPNEFRSERMNFGLLIIPDKCPALKSLPQSKRCHSLELSAKTLSLPIICDAEILVK